MIQNYANFIKRHLKDKEKKSSTKYLNELEKFSEGLITAANISKIFSGIPAPTSRHYYASVLYTTLINRMIGLGMTLPYNSIGNIEAEYCDHGTAAVITRSIYEIRLCFHYLCIDRCSDDEFECRMNLFNLHDCSTRIKIIDNENNFFEENAEILKERIRSNNFFSKFTPKRQSEILKSKTHFLYPLAEISAKAGISEEIFKIIYPMLSTHVHCLPFSFYRSGQKNRGLGIHCEIEDMYLTFYLEICSTILHDSSTEYVAMWKSYPDLFPLQFSL